MTQKIDPQMIDGVFCCGIYDRHRPEHDYSVKVVLRANTGSNSPGAGYYLGLANR